MYAVTIEKQSQSINGDVFQRILELNEFAAGIQFTASQRDRVFNRIRGKGKHAILCADKNERDYVVGVLQSAAGIKEYSVSVVDLFESEWTF